MAPRGSRAYAFVAVYVVGDEVKYFAEETREDLFQRLDSEIVAPFMAGGADEFITAAERDAIESAEPGEESVRAYAAYIAERDYDERLYYGECVTSRLVERDGTVIGGR